MGAGCRYSFPQVMQLVMIKKGEQDIPGLTDDNKPRRLGPKRAANIRKTFNLQKEDNVCSYVVRREAGKKKKAPKVPRHLTCIRKYRHHSSSRSSGNWRKASA